MTSPLINEERVFVGATAQLIANAPKFGSTTTVLASSVTGQKNAWWSLTSQDLKQGLSVLVDGYRADNFNLLPETYAGASLWQAYRLQTYKNGQLESDSGKVLVKAELGAEKFLAEPLSFYPLSSGATREDRYIYYSADNKIRLGTTETKVLNTTRKEEYYDEFYIGVSGTEAEVKYLDAANRQVVQPGSGRILVAIGSAAGQRQAAWGDWARTVGGAAPQDPDSIPTIDFVPPNLASDDNGSAIIRRSEGNPSDSNILTFVIRLSRTSSQSVSVNYSTTSGGAATAGQDFSPVSGTLTFSPGETTASFSVPIKADFDPEKDEDIFVELSGPVNGRLAGSANSLISFGQIINDDHVKVEIPTDSTIFADFAGDANFGDNALVSPGIEIDPDTDRPIQPLSLFRKVGDYLRQEAAEAGKSLYEKVENEVLSKFKISLDKFGSLKKQVEEVYKVDELLSKSILPNMDNISDIDTTEEDEKINEAKFDAIETTLEEAEADTRDLASDQIGLAAVFSGIARPEWTAKQASDALLGALEDAPLVGRIIKDIDKHKVEIAVVGKVSNLASQAASAVALIGGSRADRMQGSNERDLFFGGGGDDYLSGGGGNDRISGGRGNNFIDGGTGRDTAAFSGAFRGYQTSFSGSTGAGTVTSKQGRSSDSLVGVETLAFEDGRLTFDEADPAAAVMRMYDSTFNRAYDTLGLNNWVNQIQNGMSISTVASHFSESTEFKQTYGKLSNDAFVRQLYVNVLDRQGETAGVSQWTAALDQGQLTRGDVLSGFSESREHMNNTASTVQAGIWDIDERAASVSRLYYATFDRAPDQGGLTNWKNALLSGLPLADAAQGFADSAEFKLKYGSLDNQAFVELLYNNVLDRPSDSVGLANWTNALQSGTLDRGDVLMGFSESFEHQLKTLPLIDGGIQFSN